MNNSDCAIPHPGSATLQYQRLQYEISCALIAGRAPHELATTLGLPPNTIRNLSVEAGALKGFEPFCSPWPLNLIHQAWVDFVDACALGGSRATAQIEGGRYFHSKEAYQRILNHAAAESFRSSLLATGNTQAESSPAITIGTVYHCDQGAFHIEWFPGTASCDEAIPDAPFIVGTCYRVVQTTYDSNGCPLYGVGQTAGIWNFDPTEPATALQGAIRQLRSILAGESAFDATIPVRTAPESLTTAFSKKQPYVAHGIVDPDRTIGGITVPTASDSVSIDVRVMARETPGRATGQVFEGGL